MTAVRTVEQIQSELRAVIDGAEGRSLTDEEVSTYEALETELAQVKRDAEIRSRQAAYETPTSNPLVNTANAAKEDDEQMRAFEHYLRTGQVNSDLIESRAQESGTDAAGGFTVPDGFRNVLIERMLAFGGLSTRAQTINTETGNSLRWPTVDDTGNQGEIVAEGAAPVSGADVTFGEKELLAFRYTAAGAENDGIRVSRELLQDSAFDIQGFLTGAIGTRIARAQAAHWATGAGHASSEPEGVATAAGTVGVTLGSASTVTHGELLDLIHSVDPEYRDNAAFFFSDATLRVIRGLTDTNNRPLWLPQQDSGLTQMPGGSLLGFPVVIDQGIPDLDGTLSAFVMAFGDMSRHYVIRRVQDVTLLVDQYTRANTGQVVFHAWARADGVIQDDFAVRLAQAAAV